MNFSSPIGVVYLFFVSERSMNKSLMSACVVVMPHEVFQLCPITVNGTPGVVTPTLN